MSISLPFLSGQTAFNNCILGLYGSIEILSFCAALKGNVHFTMGDTTGRWRQFSHLRDFNLWKTSASPICIPCGLFLLSRTASSLSPALGEHSPARSFPLS